MMKLVKYIFDYWKTEGNWPFFLTLFLFLGTSIFFNYQFDFENKILKSYKKTDYYFILIILYYAIPYYFTCAAYAFFYKENRFFFSLKFWLISGYGIAILALSEAFIGHRKMLEWHFPEGPTLWFLKWTLGNLVSFSILFVFIFVYWKWRDAKKMPFYGFTVRGFDWKPYFIMILVMIPLIAYASFQPDFLSNYPAYKDYGASEVWGIHPAWNILFFETAYGIDFVSVELFFRGFLIFALADTMGLAVVMPMASLYCIYHFGKPMGETISSFLGGSVLGIIAYYSRSIYGGIAIHMAIAFLMDLAAFLQKIDE